MERSGGVLSLIVVAVLLLFSSELSYGSVNVYQFNNEVDELRFNSLIREMRCPTCQNQNIADSDAPLAQDMKDIIYDMINDGRADSEIFGFMIDRYGDFVTYNPPVKPLTWGLWFGPAALLIFVLGVVGVMRLMRKEEREESSLLSAEEQNKLDKILGKREE